MAAVTGNNPHAIIAGMDKAVAGGNKWGRLLGHCRQVKLETWLFWAAILVYLLTRFIQLPNFPIYFFTDEAIQTMSASDLVMRGFKDEAGRILPTYFENGSQFNLGFSVYWQVLPSLLLPRSVWVTRGVAALATLMAAVFLGLMLRDQFKIKHWWLGALVLAAVPAWFLHSRTAFETSLMASLYCGFLYFYLRYRTTDPKSLCPALVMAALAFYSYSPGQVVVVLSAIALFFSDLRYHRQQRKTVLMGALLLAVLVLPYIRFQVTQGEEIAHHLQVLKSYWMEDISLWEKIGHYVSRWLRGLNPLFWFMPNDLDLVRHQMKGMGHIPLIFLPFFAVGLWQCIKNLKTSTHRALLIALLAAPTGAAIVDIAITRVLVLVIPAVLLISIGFDNFLNLVKGIKIPKWLPPVVLLTLLAGMSFGILVESLVNGPTWYEDYTLYGMQYGSEELFSEIKTLKAEYPEKQIILSPNWANGTDVIARFFLGDPLPISIGSVQEFGNSVLKLDKDIIHIMLPNEYQWMLESGKFTDIEVIRTVKYPNGSDGFLFVTMNYVENIEEVIAQEIAERRKPRESTITLGEQEVRVVYPLLDMNEIRHVFDGDDNTLIRTFEANPLRIELTFPEAVPISTVTALVGGSSTRMTVIWTSADSAERQLKAEVGESTQVRALSIDLGAPTLVDSLVIEILNSNDGEFAHVHLWEVFFE